MRIVDMHTEMFAITQINRTARLEIRGAHPSIGTDNGELNCQILRKIIAGNQRLDIKLIGVALIFATRHQKCLVNIANGAHNMLLESG